MSTEVEEAKKRVRICRAKMKIASDRKLKPIIKAKLREEFYKAQDTLIETCLANGVEASRTDIAGCRKEINKIESFIEDAPEKETPIMWM